MRQRERECGRWTRDASRMERARERDGERTGGCERWRLREEEREIGGRIGWDVQVRQYTKGSPEITIFHSFARSNYFVQLKYRFSPPSPRLSRARLLQCRSLATSLSPPFHPRHPPYGSIDRAQPCDSSLSHPPLARPVIHPSSPSLAVLSLPRRFFLSFSPSRIPDFLASFRLSLFFPFSFPVCLHLRPIPAPIFNY